MTDALAVRIHEYAETSAVVVLLTASFGRVHAVAKGAKRLSNGYRGPLDKAVLYRVRLGRRGDDGLFHLNSALVQESFPSLRRDPARFTAGALVLEVAGDLMRDHEPHGELFRLTTFTLKVLDRAPPARLGLAAAFFLARAVELSGHAPEIRLCVGCGGPIAPDERPLWNAGKGGVLHPRCADREPGTRSVPAGILVLVESFWRRPATDVLRQELPARSLRELRTLLEDWLQHALERRFRAARPMEREIARVASSP